MHSDVLAQAKLRSRQNHPAQLDLPFDLPAPHTDSISDTSGTPFNTTYPQKAKAARQILLNAQILPYHLKRSSRKSIGFLIDDNGLRVTAPRWVGLKEIETSIREKEQWILTKLAAWEERKTRRALPTMEFSSGAIIPYLGKALIIELGAMRPNLMIDSQKNTLQLDLPIHATSQQIKDRVQAWLQNAARQHFNERLNHYLNKTGWRILSWALSSAMTQWGSCSAEGKLRLNWRLIHFDQDIIDYVIAHELAHLKEMNHSPRFWKIVGTLFPDYHRARKVLRHQHPDTLPELF